MTLLENLRAILGDQCLSLSLCKDQLTLEVALESYVSVARILRDHNDLHFDTLIDVCGVDYLGYGQGEWETDSVSSEGFSRGVQTGADFDVAGAPGRFRFAVVTHLLSLKHNQRVRLKVFATDNDLPVVPSLVEIWRGVNWFEREAFDLFGIIFDGHPDLRRILTDYGFVGHPFRKDFPLIGNVEVRYDAIKKRVVYEPVSIDPRVGVPRVVREDSRYGQAQAEAALGSSSTAAKV
jgi:NADH-quinone oxidoreductase subunit C